MSFAGIVSGTSGVQPMKVLPSFVGSAGFSIGSPNVTCAVVVVPSTSHVTE